MSIMQLSILSIIQWAYDFLVFDLLPSSIISFASTTATFFILCFLISYFSGEWMKKESFKREVRTFLWSTLACSPLIAYAERMLFEGKIGMLYHNRDQYGYIWLVLSFFVYFAIADIYFYWAHRWFHTSTLYKHVHSVHHTFKQLSTFAGSAGTPLEMIGVNLMATFIPGLLIPMHYQLFTVCLAMAWVWASILHCDDIPMSIFDKFYLVTNRHHHIHHQYGQKNFNFGVYTQFWDRVLGTFKEPMQRKWVESSN